MNEQGGKPRHACQPLFSGVLTSSLLNYFTLKLKAADTYETPAVYISTKIHGVASQKTQIIS